MHDLTRGLTTEGYSVFKNQRSKDIKLSLTTWLLIFFTFVFVKKLICWLSLVSQQFFLSQQEYDFSHIRRRQAMTFKTCLTDDTWHSCIVFSSVFQRETLFAHEWKYSVKISKWKEKEEDSFMMNECRTKIDANPWSVFLLFCTFSCKRDSYKFWTKGFSKSWKEMPCSHVTCELKRLKKFLTPWLDLNLATRAWHSEAKSAINLTTRRMTNMVIRKDLLYEA